MDNRTLRTPGIGGDAGSAGVRKQTLSGHTRVRCFATAVWHLVRGSGGPLYVEVEVALGVLIEIKMPLTMRPAWPRPASWVR